MSNTKTQTQFKNDVLLDVDFVDVREPVPFCKLSAVADSTLLHCCDHCFSRYLVKNSASLFSASDYEVAPPEYHRKAV